MFDKYWIEDTLDMILNCHDKWILDWTIWCARREDGLFFYVGNNLFAYLYIKDMHMAYAAEIHHFEEYMCVTF